MTIGSQPLAQLHDIVAAPAAHWWPLAPIWYLVAALLIALVVLTATAIWRWQRRRRVRNAALRALWQPLPDINAITLVLKRACLGYFPANRIAALTGPAWFSFLIEQLPATAQQQQRQILTQLAQQAYQQHPSNCAEYQQLARFWLHHALPPRSPHHD
jgi:hypothetical protein